MTIPGSEKDENPGAKAVEDACRAAIAVAWFARDSRPSGSIMVGKTRIAERRLRTVVPAEK